MTELVSRRPALLPYNPTAREIHDKVFAGTRPPIPAHGPGIRRRARRRCTPAGVAQPDSSGWATHYCVCGGVREVNIKTGKKHGWEYQNSRIFP
uniref:hypothetical protein n=1 Tax=Amycolatopsis sp. CA-096443 TaxID=3239919 RepID=UPI003F490DFF